MGHLSVERLAGLVSEAATPEQQNHLESCRLCQAELEALIRQTESIGSLPDLRPPAGDWEALEARLASEGLIRTSGLAVRTSRWWSSGWMQAAAALVLFLGGTALGTRVTASEDSGPLAEGSPPSGLELTPVGSAQYQPVSNLAEAAEVVNLTEQQYMLALLQYRQMMDAQEDPTQIGDPMSRFAALEAIVAAGRAAVQQAPTDPYLNGVLVGALVEREAFLRQASLTSGDVVY